MVKLPIPDDWNGQDWTCVQLDWPNSPQWLAILNGLLTQATRGRLWDGRTGSITDVQAIGREIWYRNKPFRACQTTGENGETKTIYIPCGGSEPDESESEDNMPAVTWLTIEDGILYMHFGPCCKVAIEGSVADIINPPPGDTNTDTGTPPTYACNKAYGIAGALFDLANDVIDAISGKGSVYEMYQPAHAILAPHNSTWQTTQLVCAAYIADTAAIESMLADADTIQWLTCVWSPLLNDTDNISSGEFYSMVTANYPNWGGSERYFWSRMLTAVDNSTVAWWARLFYDNEAPTCDCPEVYTYNGAVTWENGRNIQLESQGSSLESATQQAPNIMRFQVLGGQNENFQEVHWQEYLAATGTVQELQIEFPLLSADVSGYYPAYNWSDTNPTLLSNYWQPICSNAPDSTAYYAQPNKQVVIFKWNSPVNLDAANVLLPCKINPKNQSVSRQRFTVDAEITYSGALR